VSPFFMALHPGGILVVHYFDPITSILPRNMNAIPYAFRGNLLLITPLFMLRQHPPKRHTKYHTA